MKRYTMFSSNGSVVPYESKEGEWVKWEDVDWEICILRYENKILKELKNKINKGNEK